MRLDNSAKGVQMALTLARNRCGRIVLHLICMAHDRKWGWHWAGIHREVHTRSAKPAVGA